VYVVNASRASFLYFSFVAFINSVPIYIFVMITKQVIFVREKRVFYPQFCGHQTEVNVSLIYILFSLLMYLVGLDSRCILIYLVPWTSELDWILG